MTDPDHTRCDLMIFGALGDLARRKLFPALYQLERAQLLANGSRILALARRDHSRDDVRQQIADNLKKWVPAEEFEQSAVQRLLQRIDYQNLDFSCRDSFPQLNGWRDVEDN